MKQIHSGLGKKTRLYVRKASFFNGDMDEFVHTLRAGRFYPSAPSKMLENASSSLRFSLN